MASVKQLVVTADLEIVELDGELVVLNVDNGHYYGLNQTGALILQMAKEKATLDDVVDSLTEQYDVDADQLAQDVTAFVKEMEGHGMLRVENRQAA